MLKAFIDKINPRKRSPYFRRSLLNAAYNSLDYLLHPVLWVISAPIFVSRLGTDHFGIWMLVNTLIGMGGIMAFGLTDATIKYVSQYRARDDEDSIVRVVRSTLTMYGLLGAVTATIIFFIAPFLVNNVFKVEGGNSALAITALQIGGIGIALRFFDSVFQSTIYGYERYDLATRVTMITSILTIAINVFLVIIGYGLIVVLINVLLWIVISGFCKLWIIKNKMIKSSLLIPVVDRETLKEIFGFGIYSWIQSLGGILLGHVDRLLVASLLGTTALAYYAICLQLAQQLHAFLARAISFVFPMVSAIHETGNIDRLRNIYYKGLNFTIVAAIMIGLPIFMCSNGILSLWMGQPFADASSGILRILVFAMCIMATSIVPYYYLNGTGYVHLNSLFVLVSGSIVATAAYLMIPWLGIIGAAWARTANTPTGIISRTIVHYKVLSDRRWYVGIAILFPVLLTFSIGYGLLQFIGEPTLSLINLTLMFVLYTLIGGGLAILSSYLFNIKKGLEV